MYKLIITFLTLITFFFFISNTLFNISTTIIWAIALVLMFTSGLYFTYKLKFMQLNIPKQLKSLKKSNTNGVSSFETLSMSLASRIGVGSIAGIALAIYIGGPGVVFWMWISGIIVSINTYVESIMGSIYKEKDYDNIYIGGPSYYIKKGLKDNKLAIIYALLIIFSYVGGFLTIQSNTIVKAVNEVSNINYIITITIVCILASLIIFKDVKHLAKFSSYIVPFMGLIYLILGIIIVYSNIEKLPFIIKDIFTSAISLKAGITGLFTTIILGIQRAIFASEAGIGTSAIASASSNEPPQKQGLSQLLGIHFTIMIICNITAFIILTSSYSELNIINPNGIEITLNAFNQSLGGMGSISLCVVTVLFAFTTIVSGYYYGLSSLKFIFPNISNYKVILFKIITIIIVFLGAILSSNFIWKIVDILVAFLAIINIYAIKKLFDKNKKI